MLLRSRYLVAASLLSLATSLTNAQSPETADPDHPGRAIYEQNCSVCHDNPEVPRAHAFETLRMMNANALNYALTEGLMATQATSLSTEQRNSLVAYLAAEKGTDAWVASMMCDAADRLVDTTQTTFLTQFGIDENNTRAMTATAAGMNTADMEDLELAWSIGFPGTAQLRASPVVVGNTLFYAATGTDKVLAIDTQSACVRWVYDSPAPLRSSLTYGPLGELGIQAVLFGDGRGHVHALDASNGNPVWVKDARASNNGGRITGAVVLQKDKVIVPISDSGVGAASNPEFECCIGHGAITALDASNGEKIWEYHTMPSADYTGLLSPTGVKLRGPSGAPIWSTPTIDSKRGLIYITTGENTSHPATETSDAIIALELETGEVRWLYQALAKDVWNMACGRNAGPNCPAQAESVLKDFDFGGAAILVERSDGDFLLAGQKSGDIWALDPNTGAVLWNQRIGSGTALGGNHWGIATDGDRVFLPINDPGAPRADFDPRPGMYSFFVNSGESSWSVELAADCDNGRDGRVNQCDTRFGLSATPLIIDGALVSAGLDGRLFIMNKDSGELLFEYDTAKEFVTVNGVPGKGGSIDSHSIAAGGGMIFIGSGYGAFNQTPGNVLLAFRPRRN